MEQSDTATITQEPKPPENRIVFRVDDALNERIRITAVRRKVTISDLCTEAVIGYLDSIDIPEPPRAA